MGLPKAGEQSTTGARFADDVLRIELSGPNHSHFSVVDVPGLFQAATVYQTEEDGKMVEALVRRYIDDPRTIILYASPFILQLCKETNILSQCCCKLFT